MSEKTVTRADLGDAIYEGAGLSRADSAAFTEAIIAEMCDAMVRGEDVKISSFGTFNLRQKGERVGRNPKTGQEVPISPRQVVCFHASNVLSGRINRAS